MTGAARISRRLFLRNAASASAATLATGAGASVAYAATSPIADAVNDALARAVALRLEAAKASAACRAADAALPAWAAPGPPQLQADGSFDGADVGWPLDESIASPERGFRTVRLSPHEIRADFRAYVRTFCPDPVRDRGPRAGARAVYRRRMRRLIELLRAQRAEEAKVGLPALNARSEALCDAMAAAENEILNLPDDLAEPAVVAAKIMLSLEDDCFGSDLLKGPRLRNQVNMLRILRPLLTGAVAGYADELLDAPEGTKFADTSFGALHRSRDKDGAS